MIDELPSYKSKATPVERQQQMDWMSKQVSVILSQEKIEVPSKFLKIRCGCNKFSQWRNMYRCLYCGIWFCADCAEEHFGMKREKAAVPSCVAELETL